jgi:hypothetical protein
VSLRWNFEEIQMPMARTNGGGGMADIKAGEMEREVGI